MTRFAAAILLLVTVLLSRPATAGIMPAVDRDRLPNGVVIQLAPRPGVPIVAVQVTIRGGSSTDPPGKPGLAAVTAEMIRRSIPADALEGEGTDLQVQSDGDATRLSFVARTASSRVVLRLISDAIERPRFRQRDLTQVIHQSLESLKSYKDSLPAAGSLYYRAYLFGTRHPYGRPALGTQASLNTITLADVTRYHRTTYTGRNISVAAAGDFPLTALRQAMRRRFEGLHRGPVNRSRFDLSVPRRQARLLLVDKPDATQTYIYISQPGITRRHPDWVPVWLANTVFGDRFTSLLNEELRVNRGLTYGARCILDLQRLIGSITIATHVESHSAQETLELALHLLNRFRDHGLTAEQLESAKEYVKGTFPLENLETSEQLASLLSDLELYGQRPADVDGLFEKIDRVSLVDANAVIRKYYRTDGLAFVLVGNVRPLRTALKAYASRIDETSISAADFVPAKWEDARVTRSGGRLPQAARRGGRSERHSHPHLTARHRLRPGGRHRAQLVRPNAPRGRAPRQKHPAPDVG
jgi:predicted Zn-dependent peptidase